MTEAPMIMTKDNKFVVFDFIAATVAWQYMQPAAIKVYECEDIYEFIAGYLTGAQWGLFCDGLMGRTPEDRFGALSEYSNGKYPVYMWAYQAGRLAREIIESHGRLDVLQPRDKSEYGEEL